MWTFQQSTGLLTDKDGVIVARGYSGKGEGKNNPALQHVKRTGPIPQGMYRIVGPPYSTDSHGPYVIKLTPDPANKMFGRSAFLIHGDSKTNPGEASLGCIIVPRAARGMVWASGDRDLKVIP